MDHSYEFLPKNILCPVDFSELSGLALKYASAGARLYGAKLILLHAGIIEMPRYFSRGETDRLSQEIAVTKEVIQKNLSDLLKKVLDKGAEDLDIEFDVIDSDPAGAIIQTAKKKSIGLIVIGTHGLTGVRRLLLGSVAEDVIHNSAVPVFTVRQKAHEFIDVNNPEVSPRLERILCACEISKDDRPTLDHAVSIAERFKAGLTVLYSDESRDINDLSIDKEKLCSWIPGAVKNRCDLNTILRSGSAADQIIAQAKEEKSDLIVIGARHRFFHDAMILGRTTELVVRHAPAPVLVIPGLSE